MKGIYCFTNNINGKKYIGQSINIRARFNHHKNNYMNENSSMYNTIFYKALRKYGFENFTFQVLESSEDFSAEDLNQKEIYYIRLNDSFHNGYNMNYGGQYTSNINKKLTEDTIIQIKELLKNTKFSFQRIIEECNIDASISLISMINSGDAWSFIGQYTYPIRDDSYAKNKGEGNPNAIFSDLEVMHIRELYVNNTLTDIYKEYKDKCSFSELKKIVYGVQFKHLPCYKKRIKQWV